MEAKATPSYKNWGLSSPQNGVVLLVLIRVLEPGPGRSLFVVLHRLHGRFWVGDSIIHTTVNLVGPFLPPELQNMFVLGL